MTAAAPILIPREILTRLRRDRAVRAIIQTHRRLTLEATGARRDAERPTLAACSGGADSTALAIALRCSSIPLALAHVTHDIRPEPEARADRDHAHAIALALGVPFVEASVAVRVGAGNLEGRARRSRYRALTRLAADRGDAFIATGHHADDVLETMLMRLMRGAGPRGLAGPAPIRRLAGASLLRPMLGVSRADAERICTSAGLAWRHDATNDDTSMLRNALRARVLPVLRDLAPGVERRASRSASLLRDASGLIDTLIDAILAEGRLEGGTRTLDRDRLREAPRIVAGAVLRASLADVSAGRGIDRVTSREIDAAIRAIRDRRGDVRTFRWGKGGGLTVTVDARTVTITTDGDADGGQADRACRTLRP